jgi:hypothetical protein
LGIVGLLAGLYWDMFSPIWQLLDEKSPPPILHIRASPGLPRRSGFVDDHFTWTSDLVVLTLDLNNTSSSKLSDIHIQGYLQLPIEVIIVRRNLGVNGLCIEYEGPREPSSHGIIGCDYDGVEKLLYPMKRQQNTFTVIANTFPPKAALKLDIVLRTAYIMRGFERRVTIPVHDKPTSVKLSYRNTSSSHTTETILKHYEFSSSFEDGKFSCSMTPTTNRLGAFVMTHKDSPSVWKSGGIPVPMQYDLDTAAPKSDLTAYVTTFFEELSGSNAEDCVSYFWAPSDPKWENFCTFATNHLAVLHHAPVSFVLKNRKVERTAAGLQNTLEGVLVSGATNAPAATASLFLDVVETPVGLRIKKIAIEADAFLPSGQPRSRNHP